MQEIERILKLIFWIDVMAKKKITKTNTTVPSVAVVVYVLICVTLSFRNGGV